MAGIAVLDSSATNSFPFGRSQAHATMKRKTPSELRKEQLKRKNAQPVVNETISSSEASERTHGGSIVEPKKPELPKTKYINTRVNEIFPVRKFSGVCQIPLGKENTKDFSAPSGPMKIQISSTDTTPAVESRKIDGNLDNSVCSETSPNGPANRSLWKTQKCSQITMRDVVDLHVGNEKSACSKVDMVKAFKGFGGGDSLLFSPSTDGAGKSGDTPSPTRKDFTEFQIPDHKIPLDFTLKTSLRLVSSSTVKWCHISSSFGANLIFSQSISQSLSQKDRCLSSAIGSMTTSEELYSKALQSWTYPQSSLPPSLVSALSKSTARGESDFLSKRLHDWEDSFQNIYYMFRKSLCDIFYVYTSQFIVMFIGCCLAGKKRSCNAYISQSTRGLRYLLRKHEVHFSMPLCDVEVEQTTEDDLIELSEIEKQNGLILQMDSMSEVHNSPQSLLAFVGNKRVHSLYDFLLNHRRFLYSLATVDVPAIYSPVPFLNACLCIPPVRCKEMRRADVGLPNSSDDVHGTDNKYGRMCYSIEIKDAILPPWVICGICAAMGSDGRSYETSLTTDPSSLGLNVALDALCPFTADTPAKPDLATQDADHAALLNVIPGAGAVLSPHLRSASLRCLKYSGGSQTVYLNRD